MPRNNNVPKKKTDALPPQHQLTNLASSEPGFRLTSVRICGGVFFSVIVLSQ